MGVNTRGWEKLPIADRDTKFAFRAATDRLAAKAASIEEFSGWYFWRDPKEPSNNRNSYRMPFADVFDDGTVKLVPSAVFSAAAQLSGAHGALTIIPDAEKEQIRDVISRIYDKFRAEWDDPRVTPPWTRPEDSNAGGEPVKDTETASVGGEEDVVYVVGDEMVESVAAAAAPVKPPAAWFRNPELQRPTKLRVDDNGRVYGHLATWNTCHRGVGSSCVLAPKSITNYAHFKTGTVMTADGMLLPAGNLTYGGGHADTGLGYIAAAAHYDEAGTTVATVNVGEDAWGVWVAGAMAAGTGDVEAQQLRTHPLSGDWRRTGGNLELVAALAVNTPGFPILEPQYGLTASGDQQSLIAAGVVLEDGEEVEVTAAADEAEKPSGMAETEVAERVAALEAKAQAMRDRADRRRARTIIDIEL